MGTNNTKKFAVALYLESREGSLSKQRLQLGIVTARGEDEALGAYIHSEERADRSFPIVYHTVMEVVDAVTEVPAA